ncbi:MAG TPA: ECF-type sigma factor [Terriglobales bacterium]|nr:ECF-type sigma factor [Terriglobales bacterium]
MSRSAPTSPHDATFAEVYRTLRGLADAYMHRFADSPTLQATALVHEAYLKMAHDSRDYTDQAHFIRTAAMAMRQILVDHARARQSQKRGSGEDHLTLEGVDLAQPAGVDVLVLHDALHRLEVMDAQQAQIVELRCFIGLSVVETAQNLQISEATVKRDWAMARAWLRRELEAK